MLTHLDPDFLDQPQDDGDQLSFDEMVSLVLGLVIAGSPATWTHTFLFRNLTSLPVRL